MGKTNSQIIREALMRNVTGATAQTPVGQMESVFYKKQSGLTGNSLANQFQNFLRKQITNNGKTPVGSFNSDLLKQALVAKGLPVSRNYNQNLATLMNSL